MVPENQKTSHVGRYLSSRRVRERISTLVNSLCVVANSNYQYHQHEGDKNDNHVLRIETASSCECVRSRRRTNGRAHDYQLNRHSQDFVETKKEICASIREDLLDFWHFFTTQ